MEIHHADCLEWMRSRDADSVDLVFGSPPYEKARTYGIDYRLAGQAWVDWMAERIREMVRISRGLVAMVVEGQSRKFRWSATPSLLMADLHRSGVHLRKPPVFHRVGIPGSGGSDWLRNDYEFIVCASKGGKLPWSDNTAMGHPCKYKTGGALSNRTKNGTRKNAKTGKRLIGSNGRPMLANPGNVIKCVVGGGRMGSLLAHENEAPFPESLAEFFIQSFCQPGGLVLDPFCGSGTTGSAAIRCDRQFVGVDVRKSQVELSGRRLAEWRYHQVPPLAHPLPAST